MKSPLSLSVAVVCALLSRSAAAGKGDGAAADALFRAGRAALASGDVALACTRFAESQRLEPAPGTLLNLADCEERSGRLSAALAHFAEVRDGLAPHDFRVPVVTKRIAELEKRVPQLTLVTAASLPQEARLECDGVELGVGSLGVAIPVDPGRHLCILRILGRSDGRVELTLREGERTAAAIEPGATLVASPPPAPPVRETEPRREVLPEPVQRPAPSTNRTPVYVLGGVGIVGMLVGTTTGILAIRAGDTYRAHCTPECDSTGVDAASTGRTMVIASPIAFGIGLASLGGAALYFAFGGRAKTAAFTVAPNGAAIASSF